MGTRVTVADLEMGATWLESYEGVEGDEDTVQIARVAEWLREEVAKRQVEAQVRAIAAEHNVTMAHARRVYNRVVNG